MDIGQHIRFVKAARFGEWSKGDYGVIEKVLAERPAATADIFLIRLLDEGKVVWATNDDIEWSAGEQLTLF